ncbi:MAG: hydantoinase B/oxoprolinase family protein [Alphaproteobacteria bacterium]|nr:hydantoinase B/oxoprolinase family protein [Alphaproteobacteria bacterium]
METLDAIGLGIMWDRLISITDEIQLALVRTSFSTTVRESYDLSVVVFDADGNAMAQGSYSIPSFTGTAPQTLRHMLARFPADSLRPGDVIMTNDPWMGTGHLFDVSVMRPVFHRGRRIGYTMSVTHLPDIGGAGWTATGGEVYEEGLRLPIVKLAEEGRMDQRLLEIIATNVRTSEQVIGDIMANVTCNEVGGRLLTEFMDEYGIDDLAPIAARIVRQSEQALRAEIRKIPAGRYANAIQIEGREGPITLACAVTIGDGDVAFDFAGTDPQVRAGINVPICYTRAMACHALKCLTVPMLPNNDGFGRPVTVEAPAGCILNAQLPAATGGRHAVGHFINPLVFGALAKVLPDRAQADSGMTNPMSFTGTHRDGHPITNIYFCAGGYGALDGKDGHPTTPAPSNMTSVPAEVWENLTSMRIEHKRLLPDSGGPGKNRGGLGQEIAIVNDTGHALMVSFFAGRSDYPARGVFGGGNGTPRRYWLNGKPIRSKGRYLLEPGDRLVTNEAGGAGFGDPRERPRESVRRDLENAYVTAAGAARDYGWPEAAPTTGR